MLAACGDLERAVGDAAGAGVLEPVMYPTVYLLASSGSSPGVSWPRPHRGSRNTLMLGAHKVSPSACPLLYTPRASLPIA